MLFLIITPPAMGYHRNGPKNDKDPKNYDNLKTAILLLIQTLSILIT